MKILYCVHDPTAYARGNFWASFAAMGIELVDFDFAAETARLGQAGMLDALERLVAREEPDILFHSLIEDELPESFLARLRDTSATTTVVFFSDDDRRLDHSLARAARYNVAITNDGHALPAYRARGHAHVRHVQYAGNPAIYRPRPVPKRYDVTFVGQPYAGRPEMIRALRARGVDVRVWGDGWERLPDLRSIAGGVLPSEVMVETICASRIVLGLAWCSAWDGVGPKRPQIKGRTFEYAACGAFQLTLEDPRLGSYFTLGEEIETYRDADDLAAKIDYYLPREVERERMAQAARRRGLAEHTWERRWHGFFADLAANALPGKRPIVAPAPAPPAPAALAVQPAAPSRPGAGATTPTPAVSLVTHVYNYGEYVEAMIRSVLAQTFEDWELVILDDGSTDATETIVARYLHDPRIRYVKQANLGQTGRLDLVLQRAIDLSSAPLVAFIGGDDVCMPERLARQVREFETDPDLDVLHTNGHHIGPRGERLASDFSLAEPYDGRSLLRVLFHRNVVMHPTVMMRRRCFDRVGPFEEAWAADYRFWLKSARYLKYRYLDEKLIAYRIHPNSSSTSPEGLRRSAEETRQLRRLMRSRVTILDLYPELAHSADRDRALAAAYTDFGNRLMNGDYPMPDLALCEYDRALSHLAAPHPAVVHNVAVALALGGQAAPALALLAPLAAAGDARAQAARAIVAGRKPGPFVLAEAREISPELFDAAPPDGAAAPPFLSVVITTLDRRDLLDRCLAGFAAQTLSRERFEVIVVDDGSREPCGDVVDRYRDRLPLRYLYQDNRGLAAARNAGIAAARGRIIVPYDDDNAPHPECLAEHARFHERHPDRGDAMLAHQEWAPELAVTPLMHYVTEVDPRLWCYRGLEDGQPLSFGSLWGGCSSYKKALVDAAGGFATEFVFGYEDTEAEVRMRRLGLTVYFNSRARNYACRPVTFEEFCRRCYKQGRSLLRLRALHPHDPDVVAYTSTPEPGSALARYAPLMEKIEAVLPDMLEAGWTLPERAGASEPSRELLFRLFFVAFEYWKLKGLAEAGAEADQPAPPPLVGTPPAGRNVLVLAPELPAWDRASGSFRLFQIVKLLSERGHHVTFVARAACGEHDPTPYVQRLSELGVRVIPIDPDRIREKWGVSIDAPRVDLERLLTERHWDVAYLYFYELAAQYLDEIRRSSPATRVVVDSVDVHFLREARQARLEGDPALARQAAVTREAELAVYRRADLVVTVTEADRDALLAAAPELSVAVVPNIHPLPPDPPGFGARRDLLFVGGFLHQPNVDAVRWFCAEVWPRLEARLPGVRLHVVGNKPPDEIRVLAGERILVTGHVPDIGPYLTRCRVSVAPLRFGAGMKGKVGEALAGGLPVVATGIAAEGLGAEDGRDLLVADDAPAFAEAVVRLYEDEVLWAALSGNARRLAEARYAPKAVVSALEHALLGERLGPDESRRGARPSAPLLPQTVDGPVTDTPEERERILEKPAVEALPPIAQAAPAPDVSIVIPAWNNLRLTRDCLEAIRRHTPPGAYEVVVVDNGSTDETPAFLRQEMLEGRVRALFNRRNLGFARACNQGARLAEGRYVLFLNNDTLPHAGWLDALVAMADADPTIGVVGSKLLYPDGTVQHAGIVVGRRAGEPAPYHVYLCQPADAPWVNRPRELQMVTGACLMMERRLFESLDGFDQEYRNGHEDLDLCLRARAQGRKVAYCPASVVTHLESRTKQLMGLDEFHYRKGVDNEEGRGRRRFLERWGAVLEIDDERHYAADGVRVAAPEPAAPEPAPPAPPPVPTVHADLTAGEALVTASPAAAAGVDGPLHVLFTMYGWTEEGGGTILPRQIAQALVRRGHRVSVVYAAAHTWPGKPAYHIEEHEDAGVSLFGVYNRPALFCDPEHPERDVDDPELRRIVAGLIARLRPDVVHYHSLLSFSMGLTEDVSGAGIPSVYTSHNYWPLCPRMYLIQEDLNLCRGPSEDGAKCAACMGRLDKQPDYARRAAAARQMLGRHVDRHLAVSSRVRQLFADNGHAPERITVLHQQPETADRVHHAAACRPSRPAGGPLRVGFIGSLLPQKGAHVLIRALQTLSPGEVEAHLWGGGPQPYVEALQRLDAKRLARLHGAYVLDQLPDLLRDLDVVVVPSVWEDCAPLVVAEALAAGVPVVGSRIGGIPDFVEDGVTGLLVDPRDAVDLASALHRVRRDPALLMRLRAGIVRGRDFGAYLDDLLTHYRDVIGARPAQRESATRSHPPAPSPPPVAAPAVAAVWEGSFFLHHSLAGINRAVCTELLRSGVDLGLVNFEKPAFDPSREPAHRALAERVGRRPATPVQVHVRHRYPPDFSRPAEGRLAIILPWEFGSAPAEWVEGIRQNVDELWVPSRYVKDCFVDSGVPAERIEVIPNGFDPALLRPDAPAMPLPTAKRFKFLYMGTGLGRKGFDVLLQAYLEEFSAADDVTLIIKDQAYYPQRLDGVLGRHGRGANAPEILYFGTDVLPHQMAGFYRAADCLVHPFRGEGFGLPILEAMACGRPVIVTDHGPVREFCPDDAGWFIPCRTVTSPGARVEYLKTVAAPVWAEPDRATLRVLMRHAVDHPDECHRRGLRGADAAHARFTWTRVAARYAERLATLAGRPSPVALGVEPLIRDGLALLEAGRLTDAAETFIKAARMDGTDIAALTGLAHCTLALGDTRSARLLLQEILALDPGHAGARAALEALETQEALEEVPAP